MGQTIPLKDMWNCSCDNKTVMSTRKARRRHAQTNRVDTAQVTLGPVWGPKRSALSVFVHGWGGAVCVREGAVADALCISVGVDRGYLDAHGDAGVGGAWRSHAYKLQERRQELLDCAREFGSNTRHKVQTNLRVHRAVEVDLAQTLIEVDDSPVETRWRVTGVEYTRTRRVLTLPRRHREQSPSQRLQRDAIQ